MPHIIVNCFPAMRFRTPNTTIARSRIRENSERPLSSHELSYGYVTCSQDKTWAPRASPQCTTKPQVSRKPRSQPVTAQTVCENECVRNDTFECSAPSCCVFGTRNGRLGVVGTIRINGSIRDIDKIATRSTATNSNRVSRGARPDGSRGFQPPKTWQPTTFVFRSDP